MSTLDITSLRLKLADAMALVQSVALELESADPNEPSHASEDTLNAAMAAGERHAGTHPDVGLDHLVNPDILGSDPWRQFTNPA